ncbi:MAG: LysR family transcriptional regulator [Gammaproteobacteria bacterium]
MSDRRLYVFHTVARLKSFTKAAEALHMTQPAITFQVRQLEEQFDTRLFDRSHNGISLTKVGKCVYDYASKILDLNAEMESAVQEVTGQIGGDITIGASTTIAEYMLPPLLTRFSTDFPEASLHLHVCNSQAVLAMMESAQIDMGIVEGPITNDLLSADLCRTDELVAIVAPSHPLAGRLSVRPTELIRHPFVLREVGSGTRAALISYLRTHDLDPERLDVLMELASLEAIKRIVHGELAISVLSRAAIAKELRLGALAAIPLDPPLKNPLSFVYDPRGRYLPAVQALTTLAHNYC